jgi:hypothetical protein
VAKQGVTAKLGLQLVNSRLKRIKLLKMSQNIAPEKGDQE